MIIKGDKIELVRKPAHSRRLEPSLRLIGSMRMGILHLTFVAATLR